MLLLGWSELELKAGGDGGVVIGKGLRGRGVRGGVGGGAGAPADGTDILGQVVLEQ